MSILLLYMSSHLCFPSSLLFPVVAYGMTVYLRIEIVVWFEAVYLFLVNYLRQAELHEVGYWLRIDYI